MCNTELFTRVLVLIAASTPLAWAGAFVTVPSPSVRRQSLGPAVAAIPNHVDALYQNPAGLALPDTTRGILAATAGALYSAEENVRRQAGYGGMTVTFPFFGLQMAAGWTTRWPPPEEGREDAEARDIRQRLLLDYDANGYIDATLDDVGANLDSVLAIREDFEPFIHYTHRLSAGVAIRIGRSYLVQQSIGLRAEYFEFEIFPDQATFDVSYLVRFPHRGLSFAVFTDRLVHAVFSSSYYPYDEYVRRSVSLAAGWSRNLIERQDRALLSLRIGLSGSLNWHKATGTRDAVLEGGSAYDSRRLSAGLCVEAPMLGLLTPRLGFEIVGRVESARLAGGFRVDLPQGISVDIGTYQEKGGDTDGLVYQLSVLVGAIERWKRQRMPEADSDD